MATIGHNIFSSIQVQILNKLDVIYCQLSSIKGKFVSPAKYKIMTGMKYNEHPLKIMYSIVKYYNN